MVLPISVEHVVPVFPVFPFSPTNMRSICGYQLDPYTHDHDSLIYIFGAAKLKL